MQIAELKQAITDHPAGYYLFCGEEEYLKRYYLAEMRRAVITDDFTAAFNEIVFDGAEVDLPALTEAIEAPPMMSDYKLVVWKYADFEHMKESDRAALEAMAKAGTGAPYAVVVFLATPEGLDPGTPPKRPGKLFARFDKTFSVVNFPKSTDAQLRSWLCRHFEAEGVRADLSVCDALILRSGHAMEVLDREVVKVAAFVRANGRETATPDDVELVASSNPESDAFDLANAITERDMALAYRALTDMKLRKVEPTVILGMMARVYGELVSVSLLLDEGKEAADIETALKLNPYKVKLDIRAAKKHGTARLCQTLERLVKADTASKSGGVSGYTALEIFIAQNI